MSTRVEILRRTDAMLRLIDEMRLCEDTLDQLLSVREVPLAVPSGFFRTSIAPPPFESFHNEPEAQKDPRTVRGPGELSFSLGERIRQKRESLGMTQQDLADATGMKRPNIARLERGGGLPNLSTLLKVANGLKVTLGSLID